MSEIENRPVRRRVEQRQSWSERLQRFADSGLSVVAFCQVEQIPTQSFYYWKRKHLGIDPFAYLREALPGLFALGEKPSAEQLSAWLPDQWKQRQDAKTKAVPTG